MKEIKIVEKTADNIRILSASMVEKAKSGHPGGAMGGADFMAVLYNEYMVFDSENPSWHLRDRFFLDPGHMSPMLYSTLGLAGLFTLEELKTFRQWNSPCAGHPERDIKRGIENTSGPLGIGHAMGAGAAIAERFLAHRFGEWLAHKTYIYISDGGIQEEISQGVGRIAGFLGLKNLIMFYDSNNIQLSTKVEAVSDENTAQKYRSWGWNVITINGNDITQIRQSLELAIAETDKPTLIIGKTVMGKGAVDANNQSFENKTSTHGQPLSAAGASFQKTIENLGGNSDNSFEIFSDVAQYVEFWKNEKKKIVAEKNAAYNTWAIENKELAQKYVNFLNGTLPQLNFEEITNKPNIATRDSSGNVLAYLAKNVENMIVASADLSDSDKTIAFLKQSKAFARHDFSGAFLQAGVSELTMAAMANGMALHGGVIPVCSTFFVFSDYEKPALRVAALMETPVIYMWSHDSFRVGEDGPTHQPIEQEAQLRLMEQLKNHSGLPSVLVLRPADAAEVAQAWKMALQNKKSPTGLIFTRQGVTDLPKTENLDSKMQKGAYIVSQIGNAETPDVILLANGSEVGTLIGAAEIIKEKYGKTSRIVSVPSQGLFLIQNKEYKNEIFGNNIPVFGLTAGLPISLEMITNDNAKVVGLNHFGYSAPAGVLDEKFGFTPTAVAEKILNYIAS